MPYEKISELPEQVRNSLPKKAQEIYRAAWNSAWEEYKKPADRNDDGSREETAHKVAWSAVKQKYRKNDSGNWINKS